MSSETILKQNGFKHITTRVNQFTKEKELLFYNKKTDETITVKKEVL
jgi:hypothetical protein